MNQLSLHQQVLQETEQTRRIVDNLKLEDPLRDWFELEFTTLATDEAATELSLDEANARIAGLNQLQYLVRDHCVRLQNPDYLSPVKKFPDSFLTVQARVPSNVLDSAREYGFTIAPELLHDPTDENEQFDPVSPTAKVVGYLRGLDRSLQVDNGFSPETDGFAILQQLGITESLTQTLMSVLFQSRYHALNIATSGNQHDSKQIVEFAAGISPRGYQWAQMSPGTIFVESDLPQLMIHKAKLVRNAYLKNKRKARGVHHCCSVDVLNLESVVDAVGRLDTQHSFTIVTEGLLLYFSEAELRQFLSNISWVLKKYPSSAWVTDFVTKANLKDLFAAAPSVAAGVKAVFSQTGRSVVGTNPFDNNGSVHAMLDQFDLHADTLIPLAAVTDSLTFDVEVDSERRRRLVGDRNAWRITCG